MRVGRGGGQMWLYWMGRPDVDAGLWRRGSDVAILDDVDAGL